MNTTQRVAVTKAAPLIAAHKPFTTSGALRGTAEAGHLPYSPGKLEGPDLATWQADRAHIVYVVWSYQTPIGWVTDAGRVHKVEQWVSRTTSTHQGKLHSL
jgi:hypothetical protein